MSELLNRAEYVLQGVTKQNNVKTFFLERRVLQSAGVDAVSDKLSCLGYRSLTHLNAIHYPSLLLAYLQIHARATSHIQETTLPYPGDDVYPTESSTNLFRP